MIKSEVVQNLFTKSESFSLRVKAFEQIGDFLKNQHQNHLLLCYLALLKKFQTKLFGIASGATKLMHLFLQVWKQEVRPIRYHPYFSPKISEPWKITKIYKERSAKRSSQKMFRAN